MGILGRLMEGRRRQVLVRRFGKPWGQRLFDLQMLPDTAFELTSEGRLSHPPTQLEAGPEAAGIDAAIEGSRHWMLWGPSRGMRFEVADGELHVVVDELRFFLPHKNDYYTMGEVFHEEFYRFEASGEWAFLDVGANVGMASLYLASCHPGTVVAYELVPETAAQARRNLDLNPDLASRIRLVEAGLASREDSKTINVDPTNSASNSLYGEIGGSRSEVKLLDAANVLGEVSAANPGKRLFVKLDAEGAEYDVVERWHEAGMLDRIDILILEWHVIPGRSVDDLRKWLKEGGFQWFERKHHSEPVGFITAWRNGNA